MAVDFGNITSIIGGFDKLLKLQTTGTPTTIPTPLILIGAPRRSGLSATKIASEIITRKSEAGLPVGALPSGGVSPDEIMERIRAEVWVKNITQEMLITVAIPAGTAVSAAGASLAGPVTVIGSTTTLTKGFGVAQ